MTYLLLDVVFVAVAAVAVLVARRARVAPSLRAIGWTVAVLAVMTIVFDNLMIAAGLFEFADEHLVGLRFGRAPVEDLGYPLAVALLLPALWHLLGRRSAVRERFSGPDREPGRVGPTPAGSER